MPNIAKKSRATIRLAARSCGILKTSSGISGSRAIRPSTRAKSAEHREAGGERQQHPGRAPAERVGADDAEDDRGQAAADQDGAGEVEARAPRSAGRGDRDQPPAGEDDGDPDRDVEDEDRRPVEGLGEDAAEQGAGRAADPAHRRPEPERPVALGALGEGGGDDRQAGGGDHRGAEALQRAGADQQALAVGDGADQRGDGEEADADEEDPAPRQQVAGAAAEHQEAGEGERVGVDDPLQAGVREVRARSWIEGSATLTIEMSRMTMNCARQTTIRRASERRSLIVR